MGAGHPWEEHTAGSRPGEAAGGPGTYLHRRKYSTLATIALNLVSLTTHTLH